jgi:hypothetical protein
MDKNIADLRKSYERDALDEQASSADPLQQFEHWLQQALQGQLPEPNAMTLATVGADGRPSTRGGLLKGFDARGIRRRRCSSTGSNSSAWCASKGGLRRSKPSCRTSITPAGRSIRASAPGPRRRAR